jgi:hypothetical protein
MIKQGFKANSFMRGACMRMFSSASANASMYARHQGMHAALDLSRIHAMCMLTASVCVVLTCQPLYSTVLPCSGVKSGRTSLLILICCFTQVEEQYQREMGIAAQQQRTDAYMRSHTLSGQALLDPTGHLHPYPSDSVLVKPAGFGLGRSSPEAVAKVAKRHTGLQGELQSSLLLPSKFR